MTCESIVIWPVRQLGRVLTDTGKAVISLGRVNHILQAHEESKQRQPTSGRTQGHIDIRGLSFAYPANNTDDEAGGGVIVPSQDIIQELDIEISAGETLAIVGPPGSGKTSLIRALLRLYPYRGSIRIDGQEVSELDRFWLRSQIGVVLQDPFLYSRSIIGNLVIGRPRARQDEIALACEEAAILESINAFPDGFDEMVGERGVTLSGGQRQRLALARALLKDPPILVLDDSLSAIDTGTEKLILDSIRKRQGKHTTIIIAHRLSSVVHADRIMVLEHGRCVQLGSHAQLSAEQGSYRRLCEIQGALDRSIAVDLETNKHTVEDH